MALETSREEFARLRTKIDRAKRDAERESLTEEARARFAREVDAEIKRINGTLTPEGVFPTKPDRGAQMIPTMSPKTILDWLKEASAYAYQCEDLERPMRILVDVIVGSGTVGVRVRRGNRQDYRCRTWSELDAAKSNPLLQLIDETIDAVGNQP